jgi:hypothetical protein
MTYTVHNVRGRLRIKVPVIGHDGGAATEMVRLLRVPVRFKGVVARVAMGSCLIHHDAAIRCRDDLMVVLWREGYFNPSQAITKDEYIQNVAAKPFSFLAAFV